MMRARKSRLAWIGTALGSSFLAVASQANAQAIINFEEPSIPTGSQIVGQYGPRGVLFQNAFIEADPAAHSGARVLREVKTGSEVFTALPLVIKFTSPQQRVKLFAGSQYGSPNATLKAFDGSGNVVASDGPRAVAQNAFTTAFEVTAASPTIERVELQFEGSSYASIDDLEFEGSAPAPTPTQAPVVTLMQPVNGVDVDVPGDQPRVDIAGTVTGEGLLPQVQVTVAFKRPPEQANLPPLNLTLDLTGSGTTRQFTLPGGLASVPLGPVTVTATAENTGALKGSATNVITNLPFAVRNRYLQDPAGYGPFQYGLLGTCSIAVYQNGAIAGRNGGARAIRGDTFRKWLSLKGPYNQTGWFGCPLNEEGDSLAGARSQPFDRGRIYTRLPGQQPSTGFYVPAVFVNAIEKRGDDDGIGLPMSDPTDSAGVMRTWLFQRFARPTTSDSIPLLPTTMEIRGTPATLWLERQAGVWLLGHHPGIGSRTFCRSDVTDQGRRCALDVSTNKSAATWWEGFPCADNLGPCTVTDEPIVPPPNPDPTDFKNRFCNGTVYRPWRGSKPPEWVAVRGHWDATPVFGATTSAHMGDIDNGFTHRTHNGNCPYLDPGKLIAVPVIGPFLAVDADGLTCVSDYEFFVRPLGPQFDPSPWLPSFYGKERRDTMKTEYEVAYAAAAHNFLGAPMTGDLVHMTGRWIVDCGHDSYNTELHPIFSFARMKTVVTETNGFTGLEDPLFGGTPATRVAIWINGWYPGGDGNAIEFDVFPPPRPSPTALLHVVKPVDSGAGGYTAAKDVNLAYSIGPAGGATKVHLKFTAPLRKNPVTYAGEMLFQPGRQYWGIWYLYWGN